LYQGALLPVVELFCALRFELRPPAGFKPAGGWRTDPRVGPSNLDNWALEYENSWTRFPASCLGR